MGGDFDKSGGEEQNDVLGLRDAVRSTKQELSNKLDLLVQELSDEMKIIEKVSSAIYKGQSSVSISFPKKWRENSVDTSLSGKITHSLVVEKIVEKIKKENLYVSVIRKKIGGCCNNPTEWRNSFKKRFCLLCNGKWERRMCGNVGRGGKRNGSVCCDDIKNAKIYKVWKGDERIEEWEVSGRELYLIQCINCNTKYLPLSSFFVFDKLKLSDLDS
jgi:hypothetical protein